jgi:hypothetical protein
MCQLPDDVVVAQTFQIRGVLDPDGPTSLGGGIGAGGVVREGVGEAGGVVVLDARVS